MPAHATGVSGSSPASAVALAWVGLVAGNLASGLACSASGFALVVEPACVGCAGYADYAGNSFPGFAYARFAFGVVFASALASGASAYEFEIAEAGSMLEHAFERAH